eukprot:6285815-Alexandrium_andersonii.AAC.1
MLRDTHDRRWGRTDTHCECRCGTCVRAAARESAPEDCMYSVPERHGALGHVQASTNGSRRYPGCRERG